MNHEQHMSRALRLAALGRHASPNPMVGCVIADANGVALGEGYHRAPGGPHGEAAALPVALATGRPLHTAYVNLEPCSHFGRTPPCADALIQAGVKRVFVAMTDPDAKVSGAGIARMQAAGIECVLGICEDRARALNAAYIKHRTQGIPWVVLKTAMTLDGKVAARSGDSQWITSPISRRAVHRQLRDRCDAIISGVGTIIADNPELTARLLHRPARNPWRVIVDSRLRVPIDAKAVQRARIDGRTIIATISAAPDERLETFRELGCQILICESGSDRRVDLPDLMRRLGTRSDIVSVLTETGGELAASLLSHGLVDRWLSYVAPKAIGGREAPGPIGGIGGDFMAEAHKLEFRRVRRSGPDLVIDAHWVQS